MEPDRMYPMDTATYQTIQARALSSVNENVHDSREFPGAPFTNMV